ncbi:beta-phosphoglucomutase [Amygdalobacter nucleatus]|uniref:beta-phosphoglucomutase n=1 Tax=Amygdalobacter nucleatus TaxID=3029274 RepID=UPI0027A9F633|nr:beta-phosphoglucomutase [Amygdalobacter nucleatus]WEG36882.1 beta-phosphoglucomutase [Amygdalobacter nucleatus]
MKAIIFDLDGVLCQTDEFHYLAWKTIADELKIPFDRKINEKLRGVSRMASLEIILQKANRTFTNSEKVALAERKNAIYRKYLDMMTEKDLASGAKTVLTELSEKGLQLAIGSSSKNTQLIVDKLQIADFFTAIIDGNQIKHSKPDPEVFLLAAQKLEMQPANCLVVEDAEAGVEAAIRGGFQVAGIGSARDVAKVNFKLATLTDLLKYMHA